MQGILDYLYGLTRFGIKPGLEVTKKLLDSLGNPQNKFKSIHIAGTNGKGSTTAFTASILKEAGYKVGMYTSPHLIKFNERIKVNGIDIADEEIVKLVELIRAKAEENDLQPTFFELTTILAFLYFAQKNIDMAVVEVGLGGRLDSTNVIMPELAVITNIDIDHKEHLGETKELIAIEKAGIIKPNVPLVTAEEDENLLDIFKGKTKDIMVLKDEIKINSFASDLQEQKFTVSGKINGTFSIRLLGKHQIENACTALLVARLLQGRNISISDQDCKKGLINTQWPARLQFFSKTPLLLLDGAHNAAGMQKTAEFVSTIPNRKVLVVAFAKDKEVSKMVSLIAPLFEEVIITQGNFKPQDTSIIAREVRKYNLHIKEIPDVKKAISLAQSRVKDDELILVTGSLYMVGDSLKQLNQ